MSNKSELSTKQKPDLDAKLAGLRKSLSRPERFILSCACAVSDKAFTAAMERYSEDEIFKLGALEATQDSAEKSRPPSPAPKTFDMDSVTFSGWKCFGCGNDDWPIQCMSCKTLVCAGLVKNTPSGRQFHCRASCGLVGELTKAESISGTSAPAATGGRLSLGAKNSPMIGNSAKPALPPKR